jgi:hypothetical protein
MAPRHSLARQGGAALLNTTTLRSLEKGGFTACKMSADSTAFDGCKTGSQAGIICAWSMSDQTEPNVVVLTACGKTRRNYHSEEPQAVLSETKQESRIAMKTRRARSFAALRMTAGKRYSAAC